MSGSLSTSSMRYPSGSWNVFSSSSGVRYGTGGWGGNSANSLAAASFAGSFGAALGASFDASAAPTPLDQSTTPHPSSDTIRTAQVRMELMRFPLSSISPDHGVRAGFCRRL